MRMTILSGRAILPRKVAIIYHVSRKKKIKNGFVRFCSGNYREVKKKNVSAKTMAPGYQPMPTESEWYEWWESKGYFQPKRQENAFTVLLPPPNVTGTLHLGHALTITIQDVLLRWMRMKGQSVLWIPGFDHAGIATQVAVEKYLINFFNLTKFDLGKKEFLNKVDEWKIEKESIIVKQMKQLGASVDWTRKYYTMDAANTEAVAKAFINLYNKGLINRDNSHVNWSCFLRSAISDIEVEWKEINQPTKVNIPGYGNLVEFGYYYNIAYKICNNNDDGSEIVVSTTRPETMLGDTAIAVHPEDARYSHLKGKFAWHPFRLCKIPIVFDTDVKSDEGTGAVKITPAHSLVDFEIAKRHNLPIIDVIDEAGLILEEEYFSKFQKMKRFDARTKILNELQNLGLFRGKENHSSVLPICSRSGDVIEYLIKPQWFLKCKGMVEKVSTAISRGEVTIEPVFCKSILFEWLKQNKDWNLSRQLWWGHQIPMYQCNGKNKTVWVPAMSAEEAKLIASKKLETDVSEIKATQDPDVLDTWFSSGLLPLTVCGWPDKLSRELYPLGLMESGMDIVFFWVARMLMLGLELTGQVPFRRVVLHGLICDSYGRKMSKSLGNVVLPENVIHGATLDEMKAQAERNFRMGTLSEVELKRCIDGQKKTFPSGIPVCGADALRLTLCSDAVKSERLNFNIDVCKSNSLFCNKIWQSLMYLLKCAQNSTTYSSELIKNNFSVFDKWILSSLANTVQCVNNGMKDVELHTAVIAIKNFYVRYYCDIYLESTKEILRNGSEGDVERVVSIMFNCLETTLRLLSPFMPFVAEELYHCLPKLKDFSPCESITVADFPDMNYWKQFEDPKIDKLMEKFLEILFALRSTRNLYKLSKQKTKVILRCSDESEDLFSAELVKFWKKYATVADISRVDGEISERNVITQVVEDCTIYLYHEHNRETLSEMFSSFILKENHLKECLEKLNAAVSEPDYESQTSTDVKKKNSMTIASLIQQLKKIEDLKEKLGAQQKMTTAKFS